MYGYGKMIKNGKVIFVQLGEDVIVLFDYLNIDCVWFCGILMGGLIGLWLGCFVLECFYGLVVVNIVVCIGDQVSWLLWVWVVCQEGMVVVVVGVVDCWFIYVFCQKVLEVVEVFCYQLIYIDVEGYVVCCEVLVVVDLWGEVGQILLLMLIIVGESDFVIMVGDVYFLQQQIFVFEVVVLVVLYLFNIEVLKSFILVLLSFFQGECYG